MKASKYNERLKSRDGASELLGFQSSSSLTDWELGISNPTPEMVLKMADLYNAPELISQYCCTRCPLGADREETQESDIDRITIRALSVLTKAQTLQSSLLQITADGKVEEGEKEQLQGVLKSLTELESITESLRLWCKKNICTS